MALTHGPIPAYLFKAGLRWFQAAPATERFFAVRWDGGAYRLVAHRQGLRLPSPTGPPPGWSQVPLPLTLPAFFSATDDRDEQGFRIYGVAGRLYTPRPELRLRVGVYGHSAPLDWL